MKTTEELDTFTNVNLLDKENSSAELEFTAIENTPFTIVKQGNEYFSIIGKHRITESYLSKEICKTETEKITWDRIVQVIWAVAEKINNLDEQLKNLNNE